ncbi:MAG: plastocyanin/azurin family copper-binding protein [Halobacteriales archaeon]
MRRRALLGLAATGALSGCLGLANRNDLSCEGGDCDIGMTSTAFQPETYEATVGDTVVWGNTSSRGHTVTAKEGLIPAGADYFASGGYASQSEAVDAWFDDFGGRIDGNETYAVTFEVPGTYEYYCIPHEASGMDGVIVVSE